MRRVSPAALTDDKEMQHKYAHSAQSTNQYLFHPKHSEPHPSKGGTAENGESAEAQKYVAKTEREMDMAREKTKMEIERLRVRLKMAEDTVRWVIIKENWAWAGYWDTLNVIALVFTAFVTLYEIALLENKTDWLFFTNRFIEVWGRPCCVAPFLAPPRSPPLPRPPTMIPQTPLTYPPSAHPFVWAPIRVGDSSPSFWT